MDEKTPSPPSSPPISNSPEMATATRKRSHEEMSSKAKDEPESSMTVIGDGDAASDQQHKKEAPSSSTTKQNTATSSMAPPAKPASKTNCQKPPQSSQGSAPSTQASEQSEAEKQNVTAKSTTNPDGDDDPGSSAEDDEDDAELPDSPMLDSEPQDRIEGFDWDELQRRYHTKMQELNTEEEGIMNEFNDLCDFFTVWAQAGSAHEVERSFKRMKTQMTLVGHHEDQLEERRQHYIKVVDAFKSALALLTK